MIVFLLHSLQRGRALCNAMLAAHTKAGKRRSHRKRIAVLNPEKLDLGLTVFVMIKTDKHNQAWLSEFQETVKAFPEIIEVNRLAGEYDYLLKVITRNNQSYDAFYKRLIARIELSNVTSCFSMEQVKKTTELPLGDLS